MVETVFFTFQWQNSIVENAGSEENFHVLAGTGGIRNKE
jgi:hypothetical protein